VSGGLFFCDINVIAGRAACAVLPARHSHVTHLGYRYARKFEDWPLGHAASSLSAAVAWATKTQGASDALK
jgi:hypothetical protein